jgi:uncharacterized protein involved in exopolysaccharide biosynthesis
MSNGESGQYEIRDMDVNLREYSAILRRIWWMVLLLSLATGVATLLITMRMTKAYRASAIISPVTEEGKQGLALGGALASFGISLGGPTRVEDLETLFKSNELTIRVFGKYDLWPTLAGNRYDPKTGRMKPGWKEWISGMGGDARPPGKWDAIRAVEDRFLVNINKRSGTLTLSFESPSAEGSANIVQYFLIEGKNRLQEEALERAGRNKRFLEEQISRTIDPIAKDRLYQLYGQEVEKEMLARNREQFGFKVIDPPIPPDRKSKPRIRLSAILATVVSSFIWTVVLLLRVRRRPVQSSVR